MVRRKTENTEDPEQLPNCASTEYMHKRETTCTTTWGISISPLEQIKTFIPIYKNAGTKPNDALCYLTDFSAKMYYFSKVWRFKFCGESLRL